MSGLDPIPEENLAWDSYYTLYYDDDDVAYDFQNYTYTPPRMADDYDRTTENKNPTLDIALDNDDTTPPPGTPGAASTPYQTDAASTPYQPGATSTPCHSGEAHEMSDMSQEQSGLVHGPGEPAWNALTFIFPNANATEVEAYYDPTSKRLAIKKPGADQTSYYLYTKERETGRERLNPRIPLGLRASLGESAVDQSAALQQERGRNSQEIRSKTQTKQQLEEAAQDVQTLRQEMDALRNQSRQLDDEIRELEDRTGPLDEEAIQKRKDEKRALEAEHQRKRAQYDRAYADAQRALQLQVDINNLKLANRDIDRQINKLGIKVAKPLDELEQEKADLEKRIAKGKRVLEDQKAAKKQVEQDERALERINEDIEGEAEQLPLRERVKRIFKKYGWTLQPVVLAAGITISTGYSPP